MHSCGGNNPIRLLVGLYVFFACVLLVDLSFALFHLSLDFLQLGGVNKEWTNKELYVWRKGHLRLPFLSNDQ